MPARSTLLTDRRRLLLGLGAVAGGTLASGMEASGATDARCVSDTPARTDAASQRQPFYGANQPGVVTPLPGAGMVAAFDVVASTPADLQRLLRRLTERIAFLMQGGEPPVLDPKLPPADSGILGPVIMPDNLTVTVSLGASLFDNRPWLKALKPRQLVHMERFPNDALDADRCHGDLLLQFCANTQTTLIHALRDILKHLPEFLVLRWKQEGSVPTEPRGPGGEQHSPRNLLGFRDGTANPDTTNAALMERLVWVGEGRGEAEWARGGCYQVVRIIRMFVERWDRTPLGEQEAIIGRRKATGAPLDGGREHDEPDYAKDPDGEITPLDAHIRLANPRTPKTAENLILRRSFNYSNGVTKSGQLDQGLLFICYQADLERGFLTVQRRLNGEPLEEYIRPVGGGYFYVLPGARDDSDYLGRTLIEAAMGGHDRA